MTSENPIVFKGTQEGITVSLNSTDSFEDLKLKLSHEAGQKKKFFGDTSAKIVFKGRELSATEEAELVAIIHEHTDLKVNFKPMEDYEKEPETVPAVLTEPVPDANLTPASDTTKPKAGKKDKDKGEKAQAKNPAPMAKIAPLVSAGHNETFYHHGSLRSGQSINYTGSVVIVGNVNAGSTIIASGNIVVLGSLKGVVRAGSSGNHDCFVAALDFSPTQIRIADLITYIPDEPKPVRGKNKRATHNPAMAHAQDQKIYITPL